MQKDILQFAHEFSLIAAGQYGLKHKYVETDDSVVVDFHCGGYVEFFNDAIMAVIDSDIPRVWGIFPKIADYHSTLKKIKEMVAN